MHNYMSRIVGLKLGLLSVCGALAAMVFASVASAATVNIAPAAEKVETEFSTALPIILVVVGLVVAATLVIVFFRKHAKKG